MYCVSIADSHEHTAEVVPATSHAGDNPPGISSAEDSLPKKSNHVLEEMTQTLHQWSLRHPEP